MTDVVPFVERTYRVAPYMAVGVDDILLDNSRVLLQHMKNVGLAPTYKETPGAHTFFVWREYLSDFAPQLFR
ncbi:MAG TPA: hypothetical protein VF461_21875 [Gemmatimonadaceae bacterium]